VSDRFGATLRHRRSLGVLLRTWNQSLLRVRAVCDFQPPRESHWAINQPGSLEQLQCSLIRTSLLTVAILAHDAAIQYSSFCRIPVHSLQICEEAPRNLRAARSPLRSRCISWGATLLSALGSQIATRIRLRYSSARPGHICDLVEIKAGATMANVHTMTQQEHRLSSSTSTTMRALQKDGSNPPQLLPSFRTPYLPSLGTASGLHDTGTPVLPNGPPCLR